MSVDYKCRQIYNDVIHEVTKSEEIWKSVLNLCGRIYRYEFDNVLMVYAQRPHSTLVADYDTWKKVDRYVKRGSKGVAIYPSRALDKHCRYVFDISDTGGRAVKLTWDFDNGNLEGYAKLLSDRGDISLSGNESRGELEKIIWDFTKSEIRAILKETHAMRVKVLATTLGNQIISGMQDIESDGIQLIENSIFYTVAGRLGFELSKSEQKLNTINQITKEDMIYELGSLVSDVSCDILRNIIRDIRTVERERRMSYEHRTTVQRGSRRDAVSEHRDGGRESVGTREVRTDSDGLSEGEPLSEVQVAGQIREADGSVVSSERGSVQDGGSDDGAVSERASGEEPGGHDGDVENQRAGNEADTGDYNPRFDQQVSLNSGDSKKGNNPLVSSDDTQGEYHQISFMDMIESHDNEFDRELKELENFGEERGADTASLFSHMESVLSEQEKEDLKVGKYTYLNPKKEPVPEEYIKTVVLRGTGFVGGKKRVYQIMQSEYVKSERVKKIKAEYGTGGAGWPLEGYGLHGYDTFQAKGIRFQWRDEEGEKEGYANWNTIEQVISALVLTGEYYTPEPEFVDKEPPKDLPESEDIIDADYVEMDASDEEVDSFSEGSADDSIEELDEFAIPDEVGDMGIPDSKRGSDEQNEDKWYGMTLEELAREDELVTFAEYGREFMDEESYNEKVGEMLDQRDEEQEIRIAEPPNFHMSPFATQSAGMKTRYDVKRQIESGDFSKLISALSPL